ncbi:tRNA (N(6)-L-threonylcarbamoyladenosine(37)-C(2))-methylthiotransferase MtaB [Pelagicoccus sp. SDUM812003]|uniref:tRNA (N(6)-L-threonylcarbamoyladenosine(37)-C(2))- methylthiotransferase MtaB n=1 Tax=Pelagicoccus sp. SDUM812003 TaxID=3041267 RepID=UPI00280D3636|nr:tRNA (N(6)-L-threonylcarbamoyladenosine(37)-C(2))-methylthiotransferase MtaB [Pelagicoccus sp. SDUM812003]MDQ8203699.1 tRNA (N(6)-L-threonylcarbamoyladenosine(37)-C(2))-methylthiotransferase MtaB [Pelagicoccus sp. SDUM812003]
MTIRVLALWKVGFAMNDVAKKRACLHTLGCRLNQSETLLIQQGLEQRGYEIVPFGEPADLGIINTCTVTNLADSKCRQTIRQFVRRNPEAYTAVIGCYSQMGAKEIAEIGGVDLIIGNQEKMSVIDYVGQEKNEKPVIIRERISKEDFSIRNFGDVPFNQRANLKIQDGCSFVCSFCIIPFARGAARARDMENLLEEARLKASQGIREIVITGVNIGTYETKRGGLLAVLEKLNAIPGIDRIRISSIEPTTIPTELFALMNDPQHALLPFFHIPLQSGCDKVLREMRRKYTISEYLEFLHLAHDSVPGCYIGTDIMVGFSGETDEEFQETCQVFLENPFDFCHVFSYSERQGTVAARREDQVPIPERARRSAYLRRLSAKKRYDFYESHLGKEMRVLFENPKPDSWPSYTDNYIRVVVPREGERAVDKGLDLANRCGRVRLRTLAADYVEGELLEMLD